MDRPASGGLLKGSEWPLSSKTAEAETTAEFGRSQADIAVQA